jgi:hypothetical protein
MYFEFDEKTQMLSYRSTPTAERVGNISLVNASISPTKDSKGKRILIATKKKEYVLKADSADSSADWIATLTSLQTTDSFICQSSLVTFNPCVTMKTFECTLSSGVGRSSNGTMCTKELNLFARVLQQRFGGDDDDMDYDPAIKKLLQLLENQHSNECDEVYSPLSPSITVPLKTTKRPVPVRRLASDVSSPPSQPAMAMQYQGAECKAWNLMRSSGGGTIVEAF